MISGIQWLELIFGAPLVFLISHPLIQRTLPQRWLALGPAIAFSISCAAHQVLWRGLVNWQAVAGGTAWERLNLATIETFTDFTVRPQALDWSAGVLLLWPLLVLLYLNVGVSGWKFTRYPEVDPPSEGTTRPWLKNSVRPSPSAGASRYWHIGFAGLAFGLLVGGLLARSLWTSVYLATPSGVGSGWGVCVLLPALIAGVAIATSRGIGNPDQSFSRFGWIGLAILASATAVTLLGSGTFSYAVVVLPVVLLCLTFPLSQLWASVPASGAAVSFWLAVYWLAAIFPALLGVFFASLQWSELLLLCASAWLTGSRWPLADDAWSLKVTYLLAVCCIAAAAGWLSWA